ncbi:MAG TPA: hypothetical protein VLA51_08580, partial [Paracoccaceae bacterium]|nr:hypothetical protein [Paracoccaceae bacterium]
ERNDTATARAIRDSILRAPGDHGTAVGLLAAEIEHASGDMEKAETLLEPIVGTTGPAGLVSTIASIQLHIETGREAPHGLTTTAEALLLEATGGPDETPLREGLALAYASQDRYEAAFGILAARDLDNALVWQMLANDGADSEILTFAIFGSPENTPTLASATERALALRLLALGFPDNAMYWLLDLQREGGVLSEADRSIIAQAELQRMDAHAAIDILDGISTEKATRLRAESLALLGDKGAVETFQSLGLTSNAAQVARHQGAWADLIDIDTNDVWADAAVLALGTNWTGSGPEQSSDKLVIPKGQLALTRDILNENTNARELLEMLIAE